MDRIHQGSNHDKRSKVRRVEYCGSTFHMVTGIMIRTKIRIQKEGMFSKYFK